MIELYIRISFYMHKTNDAYVIDYLMIMKTWRGECGKRYVLRIP